MSKEERGDVLLILKHFGPMDSRGLAMFYNNSYSYKRNISAMEIDRELSSLVETRQPCKVGV